MVIVIYTVMPVLILKNISAEGPGTIADFLVEKGISYRVIELETEAVPDTGQFDTLVIMGGPMSVNDDIPYIRREEELVREFLSRGKRILGVCLGAQIMARALGAAVYVGPQKEIGWYYIELTEQGERDPLMRQLAADKASKKIKVFQWHGETFDIPVGAERVASSEIYPNQAFRVKESAYAFQFHIEVTKDMIYEWLRNEAVDMDKIREQTEEVYDNYIARARNFYEIFFKTNEL